jgi:hypothetical protein
MSEHERRIIWARVMRHIIERLGGKCRNVSYTKLAY